MKRFLLSASALLLFAGSAFAHDYTLGDLSIHHPVARATPANAPVSAGYMTITNNGAEADRLIGASVDFAGKAEIHEMTMDNDVMKMRQLQDGLEIPAGGTVTLMPGGYHVMFMKLGEQLKEGETRKATLLFEKAGKIDVELNVENLDKIKKDLDGNMQMKMDHPDMNHGNMNMDGMKSEEMKKSN